MKYIKIFAVNMSYLIISMILLSVLYYYNIIDKNIFNVVKIIVLILAFIRNGRMIEKVSDKKYIMNIFWCFIYSILLLGVNLVYSKINYRLFIYILVIVLSSLLGAFSSRCKKKK